MSEVGWLAFSSVVVVIRSTSKLYFCKAFPFVECAVLLLLLFVVVSLVSPLVELLRCVVDAGRGQSISRSSIASSL